MIFGEYINIRISVYVKKAMEPKHLIYINYKLHN